MKSLITTLKTIGGGALGFIAMVVLFALGIAFIFGMVWVSDKAMPWLIGAARIAFNICLFVLLPMCIFRKLRPWAGVGFVYASLAFGILIWAVSCVYVVQVWGYGALVVGLLFAGVGVVPVALLAALVHGQWSNLLALFLGVVLTFGSRILGAWLTERPTTAEPA